MNWQRLNKIVFIAFIFLIIGLFIAFEVSGYEIDSRGMGQYLNNFGIWAPLLFIIIYTIGTIFIPATPFMIIAGILFGFKFGVVYMFIGSLLSAILVFHTSRKFGKSWVEKILEHRYLAHLNEYNQKLESEAFWHIIILRTTPIMPFNALSILLGVSKVKTRDYVIGTAIGFLPSAMLTVYLGTFVTRII